MWDIEDLDAQKWKYSGFPTISISSKKKWKWKWSPFPMKLWKWKIRRPCFAPKYVSNWINNVQNRRNSQRSVDRRSDWVHKHQDKNLKISNTSSISSWKWSARAISISTISISISERLRKINKIMTSIHIRVQKTQNTKSDLFHNCWATWGKEGNIFLIRFCERRENNLPFLESTD